MPLAVEMLALLVMVAALVVMVWAAAVNRFFSSVIRIQADRGHHLARSGPYGYVRHPAYAASPFLFVGGGLALGVWRNSSRQDFRSSVLGHGGKAESSSLTPVNYRLQ